MKQQELTPLSLKMWRERHHVTQKELANLLNHRSVKRIQSWEQGIYPADPMLSLALNELSRKLKANTMQKHDLRRIKGLKNAKLEAENKARRHNREFYVFETKTNGVYLVDCNQIFEKNEFGVQDYAFGDAIFTAFPSRNNTKGEPK